MIKIVSALKMLSQAETDVNPESVAGLKEPDSSKAGTSGAVTPGAVINGEGSEEFLSTGRTGRRNAMPDILGEHMETGTADLPEKFESLSTDRQGTQINLN